MLGTNPQRIFIDATYTLGSGKSSGIERVVRNLTQGCKQLGREGYVPQARQVVSYGGAFYELDAAALQGLKRSARMQSNVLATMPAAYRAIARWICSLSRSKKLRKWMLPQPGHLGWFKLLHSFVEKRVFQKLARTTEPLELGDGDIMLLPDAYWIKRLRDTVWPAANEARQNGAIIATLIYDLIPLTHPEFVGNKRRDAFAEYLNHAATHSDLLISISKTVREELAEYLDSVRTSDDNFTKELSSFELGAELNTVDGEVRESVRDVFSAPKPPYLMVATFDPRKNHRYLLDAFELLWKREPDVSLCFVGRIGSRCEDIVTRILEHERLGTQLHLFDDLTDVELQECYRNARGVVFPSVVEGFGLPIVESLWFGKKTFVSDTPIHREVGRDDCTYFGLTDPAELTAKLAAWEQTLDREESQDLPTRRPTNWRTSCEQVLQICLEECERRDSDIVSESPPVRRAA